MNRHVTDSAAPHARSRRRHRLPMAVAIVAGIGYLALGAWAMADPRSFFDAIATFDPYNPHFVQDIGAFQIGLGVVLVLAASRAEGLAAALLGVGAGTAAHTVSHVIGRDLGGSPQTDIPTFGILAFALLGAGIIALGSSHSAAPPGNGRSPSAEE